VPYDDRSLVEFSGVRHGTVGLAVVWLCSAWAASPRDPGPADVDRLLRARWQKEHVTPSPKVDDARFLRRVYLDLVGTVPSTDATLAFLADAAPGKRDRVVRALLDSPRFAVHWAHYWEGVLLGREMGGDRVDRAAFRDWLRGRLEQDAPWDQVVRALVTATGQNSKGGKRRDDEEASFMMVGKMAPTPAAPDESPQAVPAEQPVNGAVNWYLRYADAPADLAGNASRAFLGIRIQCAQCHDHPTESWKQEDFRRFTACFARIRRQPLEKGPIMGLRRIVVDDAKRPQFGGPNAMNAELAEIARAPPAALDGTSFAEANSPREALAAWMTQPKNPWFARALVNRLWGHLLGRGFVEPVDDMRPSNPVTAPEVLEALAQDFAKDYDLKRLFRRLCATQAYQLSSDAVTGQPAEAKLWSRYPLKPLGPDDLLEAIVAVTHIAPAIELAGGDNLDKVRLALRRQFVNTFDVDEDSDRVDFEGTIPQALMLQNGSLVNHGVTAVPEATLKAVLDAPGTDEEKMKILVMRAWGRSPTPSEVQRLVAFVNAPHPLSPFRKDDKTPDPLGRLQKLTQGEKPTPKSQAYEDVFWALLNSSEFTFNH